MFHSGLGVAIGLLTISAVSPAAGCVLPPAAKPHEALEKIKVGFPFIQEESHQSYRLDLAAFTEAMSHSVKSSAMDLSDASEQKHVYSECLAQVIKTLSHIEYGTREILIDTLVISGNADWQIYLHNINVPFNLVIADSVLHGVVLSESRFDRNIELRAVKNSDRFFIGKSQVQGSFLLEEYKQEDFLGDDIDNVAFRISASRFDSDIFFKQLSVSGTLRLHDNKVSNPFRVENSQLGTLRLAQNHLDDLGIYTTKSQNMSFYSNDFDAFEFKRINSKADIFIYENDFADTVVLENVFARQQISFDSNSIKSTIRLNDVFATQRLAVDSNTITKQAYLQIGSGKGWKLDEAIISISNNLIQGFTDIGLHLPALHQRLCQAEAASKPHQPMRVSFFGTVFEDVVSIRSTSSRGTPEAEGIGHERLNQCKRKPSEVITGYCFRADVATGALLIDLSHAKAGRVDWGLPLGDCRYRWVGEDFHYRDFEATWAGGKAGPPIAEGTPANGELTWRFHLNRPEPSALLAMAQNADDGGRFSDGRQLLYEAKEMHYKPSCSMKDPDCFGKSAMFGYLWLSGFGVKPERVVIMLAVVWLAFLALYWVYYTRERRLYYAREGIDKACQVVYVVPRVLRPLLKLCPPVIKRVLKATRFGFVRDHGNPPPGFQYYSQREPTADFTLTTFSLDATLPVLNLHLYDTYYPEKTWALLCTYAQHVLGWMLVASLLTSVAVL